MPIFIVRKEWSGYSRGYTEYEVKAESKEQALNNYDWGTQIAHEVVRDDTVCDGIEVISTK